MSVKDIPPLMYNAFESSIEEIIHYGVHDASEGYKPYPRRYGIKGRYGVEGEEIYEAAYFAVDYEEDAELLASKWGYKIDGPWSYRITKIE